MQLVNLVLGLGLAAVGLVQAQFPAALPDFAGIPACGETCVRGVLARAASLGCASDLDFACLCAKPDFHNGVKDCITTSCAADLQPASLDYVKNRVCAGTPPPAVVAIATPAPTPTTTTPITLPAASDPAPTTTSASVSSATTSAPSSVQSSASSTTSPTPVSSSSVTSSSISSTPPERTQSASQSSTNGVSSTAAATSTPSPSPTAAAVSSGLSLESRIGLGVGAAAAFMALIGIVACLLVSRRRKAANSKTHTSVMQRLKISEPMAGSGRTYANDHHNRQYEAGQNELETKSKRYEEYEPRVSPRNMV